MTNLGVKDMPGLMILDDTKSEDVSSDILTDYVKKYRFKGDFTTDNLVEFLGKWKDGTWPVYMKTEAPPMPGSEEEYDHGVKVVVGSTFLETVNDKKKFVLIQMYISDLSPVYGLGSRYVKVAEHYKHHRDVVVAKINAQRNDLTHDMAPLGIKMTNLPTMVLYPKKEVTRFSDRTMVAVPVQYHGKWTADSIIAWVNSHRFAGEDKDAPAKDELVELLDAEDIVVGAPSLAEQMEASIPNDAIDQKEATENVEKMEL